MSQLKLQIGKSYKTRAGATIRIISELEEGTGYHNMGFRFVGGLCGQYFTERGRCYVDDDGDSPGDLVEEVGSSALKFAIIDVGTISDKNSAESFWKKYPPLDPNSPQAKEAAERVQRNLVYGKHVPAPSGYTTITDGMCLVMLGGLSGEIITQLDVDQNCSVLAKHAIIAIKAAFEHGKTVGRSDIKPSL